MLSVLKKLFSPYRNVEIVANCNIEIDHCSDGSYTQFLLRRLAGLYPLVKKNGEYFIARGLPPMPPSSSQKIIKGHLSGHPENIFYAMYLKKVPIVNGHDIYYKQIGEMDVKKAAYVLIDGDKELKIPEQYVGFI